jgi:hypothetical protein
VIVWSRFLCAFAVFGSILTGLMGCASLPQDSISLTEALESENVVTLPIQVRENGIIVLKGLKIGDQNFDFLMDTGATRSAVFEKTKKKIDQTTDNGPITVRGINQIQTVNSFIVPELSLGKSEFFDVILVELPDRLDEERVISRIRPYDGLIGMDIMSRFALHLDRKNALIHLIPKDMKTRVPTYWGKTKLFEDPFGIDSKGLHFFYTDISSNKVPSLLDTGAELSIINWNEENFPLLRGFRKRLQKNWEFQGAVGVFEPRMRVNVQELNADTISWTNKHFIAMEFGNFDILGIGDDDMMIAGVNLLDHEQVFIDFQNDLLAMKPNKRSSRFRPVFISPY